MITRARSISFPFLMVKTMGLFVVWVLFSASFELHHLVLGFVLSFFVAWINSGHALFIPKFQLWVRIILYIPWLFYKIFQSGIHLSRLILHPALPISPRLITVNSSLRHHGAVVLFGNSITLTPGTITAEVDRNTLVVHAMDDYLSEDLENKDMELKVAAIFRDVEPDL